MAKGLSVLIVEDSDDDAALLILEFEEAGFALTYRQVCTPEDMQAALDERPWDAIVSDWAMPRFDGLSAYRLMRSRGYDIPFIIVSGTIGEEIAVEALRAGVHDFMPKGKFARLLPAIEREMREAETRKRKREAEIERDRQRDAKERSARLLQLVLESVPDGVVVADERGHFVLWNPAAESLMRMPMIDLDPAMMSTHYGLFMSDKTTPYPAHELPIPQALLGNSIDRQEQFLCNAAVPDGAWLSVNSRPLRDENGVIRGAVAVFRDVTKEKVAQEQLMVSDRMASIGMLAAGVGHEINNPLSAVLTNIDLARTDLAELAKAVENIDIQELREMIGDAYYAADRVRQIVRDLKMFSRHEDARSGAVDIHQVLESSLRMAWNEIRHRAHLIKEYGEVPLVEGSESRLGQVFLNLIINAAQAIPAGRVDSNTIRVRTRCSESGHIAIEVCDTGSGIPPETQRFLFTPFFTTKAAGVGTGLGLAICHRIVTGLGGTIEIESEVGQGTLFRVLLPPARRSEATTAAPSPVASKAKRRGRILVVDDEPMIMAAIRRTLAPEHEVVTTSRAAEALDLVRRGREFDLILCDVMMPQMTGMELHEEISKESQELSNRMIFLTGGAFTTAARKFLDQVSNPCVEKPFDPKELQALVNDRIR